MHHTFKIGDTVSYYPSDRMHNTARGTYTVTGLMPVTDGQQPEYRIKHFSERLRARRVGKRVVRGVSLGAARRATQNG
jgi:hypothetical protein